MSFEIKNKVAENTNLITFDLETFYPEGTRTTIDISQWLKEGLLLIEKEFRSALDEHPWQNYKDHYIALYCSTDAIIPAWAYMLISTKLAPFAKYTSVGSLEVLNTSLYISILNTHDFNIYTNKFVVLKGCSNKPVPQNAYLYAIQKLTPFAKSIMYGEACSTVPLFKKK